MNLTTEARTEQDSGVTTAPVPGAPSAGRPKWLPGLAPSISLALLVVGIAVWETIVRAFNVSPYIFPAPSAIWDQLRVGFTPGPASLYGDIWITFQEMFLGFGIATVLGVTVGLLMAQMPLFENIAYPYVFAFKSIPSVATAPLVVIWLGYGITSKVATAVMVAFFPMMVSALAGFKAVDAGQVQMFRALCASRRLTFFKLRLPSALPILLAGVDMALVYSLLGTIVAEFVSGQSGLGVRILVNQTNFNIAGSFAVIMVLSVIAITVHMLLGIVRRRYLFWTPSEILRQH